VGRGCAGLIGVALVACGADPPPLAAPPVTQSVVIPEPELPRFCARDHDAAACRTDCKRGKASGCALLGSAYYEGKWGVPQDKIEGIKLLTLACDVGVQGACQMVSATPEGQFRQAELECQGGVPGTKPEDVVTACYVAGSDYVFGKGVERNVRMGIEIFKRACEDGDGATCFVVASTYFADESGVRDYSLASTFASRACDFGKMSGCDLLGTLYDDGLGVTKDPKRAFDLASKACKTSNGKVGCWALARHYLNGDGVNRDEGRAHDILMIACPAGDENACRELKEHGAVRTP
jgi:TPR repeat protein